MQHAPIELPFFLTKGLPLPKVLNGASPHQVNSNAASNANIDDASTKVRQSPRSYQLELFEEAKKNNIIAVLDTGTGKTMIASLLVKHYVGLQRDAEKENPETVRRIAFFMVPTNPLAFQQKKQLEIMVKRVEIVVGESKKGKNKKSWEELLEAYDVIVCTPAILKNALEFGYLTMNQALLLVFDEAHHAIGHADYAIIMQKHYPNLTDETAHKPRVLGLTASPVTRETDDPVKAVEALENQLKSVARTIMWETQSGYEHLGKPHAVTKIIYKAAPQELPQSELMRTLKDLVKSPPQDLDLPGDLRFKLQDRIIPDLEMHILRTLGVHACDRAIEAMAHTCHRKSLSAIPFSKLGLEDLLEGDAVQDDEEEQVAQTSLLARLGHLFPGPHASGDLLSDKVKMLFSLLYNDYRDDRDFSGIIFRRDVADRLAELIRHEKKLSFLRVGVLKGHGKGANYKSSEGVDAKVAHQYRIVEEFWKNNVNLLVATAIAEEGLDIPACKLVVRFDIGRGALKLGSLIQSRGRARKENSKFCLMVEENHPEDNSYPVSLQQKEKAQRGHLYKMCTQNSVLARWHQIELQQAEEREMDLYAEEVYKIPATGAVLHSTSAISLLNRLCQIISEVEGYEWSSSWTYELVASQFYATVTLPGTLPREIRVHRGGPADRIATAQRLACRNAIIALHKEQYFDDNLQPVREDPRQRLQRVDDDKAALANDLNSLRGRRKRRSYQKIVPADMEVPWQEVPGGRYVWLSVPYTVSAGQRREMYRVGIITRRRPVDGIQFSLWPDQREVMMTVIPNATSMIVNDEQWDAVKKFHVYLMSSFLKDALELELDHAYFCIPLIWQNNTPVIDWTRLLEIANYNPAAHDHLLYAQDIVGRMVVDRSYYRRQFAVTDLVNPDSSESFKEKYAAVVKKYKGSGQFKYRTIKPIQPILYGNRLEIHRRINLLQDVKVEQIKDAKQYRTTSLLPEYCEVHPFTQKDFYDTNRVPSILFYFELFCIAHDTQKRLSLSAPVGSVLQALSAPQTGLPHNYERLETLGDSFLKLAINLQLFARFPNRDEGHLSMRTNYAVSNYQLFQRASNKEIPNVIISATLSRSTWRPFGSGPGRWDEREKLRIERSGKNPIKIYPRPGTQILSDKQVADVMEGLLGAAVITGNPETQGVEAGAKTMKAIYDDVIEEDWTKFSNLIQKRTPTKDGSWKDAAGMVTLVDEVQEFIGYKFNSPGWLIEALTHATAADAKFNSYQRLEFLGDAVLGYLAVRYFFYAYHEADPAQLSDCKDASVCNSFLANIAVSASMQTWLRHMSAPLSHGLQSYKDELIASRDRANSLSQQGGNRVLQQDVRGDTDDALRYWEDLDTPKAASDMVEAILGAVFVDSKLSTNAVWKVMQKIWLPWVEVYIKPTTVKRIALRVLSEELLKLGCVEHKVKTYVEGPRQFVARVFIHGRVFAEGRSEMRKKANTDAANAALDILTKSLEAWQGWCTCQGDALEAGVYVQGQRQDWANGVTTATTTMNGGSSSNGSNGVNGVSHIGQNGSSNSETDDGSESDDDEDGVPVVVRRDEIPSLRILPEGDEGYDEHDHQYTQMGQVEADGGEVVGV
ncbi:hypothetical protein SmJEL517_g04306 [Synchytrium microbalum]|uniref:Dicer-like protein 1 n=1 Tax=Synchytrium microbalum TaxID=1806994 RepID=A0A507C0L1_9FUNG|nr:uncharacterized protein SmJEL517_g04306 [Synchytrium microbalum]TPX32589.1 hypothetical protein SmJEL517_g04306 [Synchytrium microbalum]